jgi:hypothetical protein
MDVKQCLQWGSIWGIRGKVDSIIQTLNYRVKAGVDDEALFT